MALVCGVVTDTFSGVGAATPAPFTFNNVLRNRHRIYQGVPKPGVFRKLKERAFPRVQ